MFMLNSTAIFCFRLQCCFHILALILLKPLMITFLDITLAFAPVSVVLTLTSTQFLSVLKTHEYYQKLEIQP